MPEGKSSPKSSFEISAKQFLEDLNKLPAQCSGKNLWLSVHSEIVSLTAIGSNIHADAQQIHLFPRPLESDHQAHTGISVFLPEIAWLMNCEKRTNEHGGIRLSVEFRIRKEGDTAFHPMTVVIATSEEFLTVADSETRLQ